MTRCAACPTDIDWAVSPEPNPATGRVSRMPVDHDSAGHPTGNLAVWRNPQTKTLHFRVLRKGEEPGPGEIRGMSHYATCADPARFRDRART
jgi:hypothetical protein